MSEVTNSKATTPLPQLVHYFEVRSQLQSDYIGRAWQRLNWFMTLHLGAFGLMFSSFVKSPNNDWYFLVTLVMALMALLWTALGYEDFQNFRAVNHECKELEKLVQSELKATFPVPLKKRSVMPFDHARIIYVLPMMIFTAWLGLAIYLL